MAPMTTPKTDHYAVTATRSHGMWELEVPGVGTTQGECATEAEDMIRDLIDIHGGDADGAEITIAWHVDASIDAEVAAARSARAEAERLQATAARAAASHMRDAGLTGRDIAAVLSVSEQRVSQLLSPHT